MVRDEDVERMSQLIAIHGTPVLWARFKDLVNMRDGVALQMRLNERNIDSADTRWKQAKNYMRCGLDEHFN